MNNTENSPAQGNILDKIVVKKWQEIEIAKTEISIKSLEESEFFSRNCYSMRDFILNPSLTGIIAEFKRKSPSKGIINDRNTVEEVTTAYVAAGASALSVLTDESFFGGHKKDLIAARRANDIPILRKDFMLDEFQIIEAKSLGADIILLIAAILSSAKVQKLARCAKNLGLNVLLEVHNLEELNRSLCDDLDAVGVNNRNLGNFSVSVQHSYDLADHIPSQFLKISESGISDPKTIRELKQAGFDGFLIGENFMKESNPGGAMKDFVSKI
ncbi:indole-3-glycerol phosphate synthase TrpC [Daejeonella sp. H1SJ63]|uniref:indole-3-glycerol phosphate synthase TrpC n=1 Tax=Daejeonella sp. H1SJ63 TaxID=3034145 RepID=UPI0023EAC6E0|nr:indole-3-glycerol phosphate synthase TrpC [Daejeonella sp. H1SJ63]